MSDSPHPLRRYRDAQDPKLSRDGLAGLLGVSAPTIHRWESGARKIDVDLLERVVAVTGIPASQLRPDLARLFVGGAP